MAPRFQHARPNGNTLTITVVDNSNPVTNEEIDFRHINAELRAEVIQLKARVVELQSLHSEVTNLLDSVRPRPNNPYRGGEIK